jgi:hypothetical protein
MALIIRAEHTDHFTVNSYNSLHYTLEKCVFNPRKTGLIARPTSYNGSAILLEVDIFQIETFWNHGHKTVAFCDCGLYEPAACLLIDEKYEELLAHGFPCDIQGIT